MIDIGRKFGPVRSRFADRRPAGGSTPRWPKRGRGTPALLGGLLGASLSLLGGPLATTAPPLGAPPVSAAPASQLASPSNRWQAPLCGPQPVISAVFDHEHPTYGCPPNGNPRCDGHNGLLRLYNNRVDNRRLYEGHNGWDYRTRGEDWRNVKRAVHAVAGGVVRFAGWHAPGYPDDPQCSVQAEDHALGYGLMVLVDHGGEASLYGHLSAVEVRPGQRVARGARLGASGATGNAAGPHLHLGAFQPDGPGLWHAFDPYGWNEDWQGGPSRPLPPELDPWFVAGGPRSVRRLVPGAPQAPGCLRTCGPGLVVDNADPGFDLGCDRPPCRWRGAKGGWEGALRRVDPRGARPDHWARWQAPLPPGRYAVEIYLPAWRGGEPAHAVPYHVGLPGGATPVLPPTSVVDQHAEGNVWVSLGAFDFAGAPSVLLRNGSHLPGNWGYSGTCRSVLADAVRFTPTCADATLVPGAGQGRVSAEGRRAEDEAPTPRSSAARRAPGGLAANARALPLPHALSAYPPPLASPASPAPPTTTPPPDAQGRYPPPTGLPHAIVPLEPALAELDLRPVALALATRDGTALADLIGGRGRLALDPPWATEGWGLRLDRDTLLALLDRALPPRDSPAPVIQGFFGEDCWPRAHPTCAPHVVIAGLRAGAALPARAAKETIGPPPPVALPSAAAWQLLPDGTGGLWWRRWHAEPGGGYHALLDRLAEAGLGTYYVLR